MKKSKARQGLKPVYTVPGAVLLVTLLAGLVGLPQNYVPPADAPALSLTNSDFAQAVSDAIHRPIWSSNRRLEQAQVAEVVPAEVIEAAIVPAAAPAPATMPEIIPLPVILSGQLPAGIQFSPHTIVRSANQEFSLEFQPDGDLVLLHEGEPIFSVGAVDGEGRVAFGPDGNLVQYVGDQIVNQTDTADLGGVALRLTDDGNVLIVDAADEPVWGVRDVPGSRLFLRLLNNLPAESPEVDWSEFYGPNSSQRVLLTYDDCPKTVESFIETIDFAHANDIGLLLFPTTDCVRSFENRGFDLVEYARERGMWVGNHSISHPQLTRLSKEGVIQEISQAPYANLVRPPFGAVNAQVRAAAEAVGSRIVLWNVDTNDWQGKSTQQIIDYVVTNSHPGANVLMHMQHHGFNPTALGAIADGLAARGLDLCPTAPGPTGESAPAELCM